MSEQEITIKFSTWLPIKNIFRLYVIAWVLMLFFVGFLTGIAFVNKGSI